ncbi:phospholipase A2 inhibitor and Ly6/PLAUR domain-containing protein-like [Candoia aspera]|uniref:phospholipase A2 inhibitor and Ly6/PLAUR domain-containing protein-like n=1 Tax=Candoia aspera TaxID=51853 RepID=UPI002FD7CAF9
MKLLSLYIFALLAPTEKPTDLTCHDSTTQSKTCIGTKCYSQNEENTIVGDSSKPYSLQSCLPSCKELNIKFTFGEGKYFRTATKCCETDNCNTVPEVPSGDTKTSNLECPACFNFSSTPCEATVIKCPEKEDQCVNITGIFTEGSEKKLFYGRGCTTLSDKKIALGQTIYTSATSWLQIYDTNVEKATDSSWSVQGSFMVTLLLSGLIGIQPTNILY